MESTHTSPTDLSSSYLETGLRDLQKDRNVDPELQKQAANCHSCLFTSVETTVSSARKGDRDELVRSSINIADLADTDPLDTLVTKLKLRKLAAHILSKATAESDKTRMKETFGIDCDNACRVRVRGSNCDCSLGDSAFAERISGKDDKYRFWEHWKHGNQSGYTIKTIGQEGLSDRLGVNANADEVSRRARRCNHAPSSKQLDEVTQYIIDQPDGTYFEYSADREGEDCSYECRINAQQFRDIFGLDQPPSSDTVYNDAKTKLRKSSLNFEAMRNCSNQQNTKLDMYGYMAWKQVGRILMADKSQHATVRKLREQRSDWEHAIFAGTAATNRSESDDPTRAQPDIADSHWFIPTDPEAVRADPWEQLYDHVKVEDGTIIDVEEVTSGYVRGAMSQEVESMTKRWGHSKKARSKRDQARLERESTNTSALKGGACHSGKD